MEHTTCTGPAFNPRWASDTCHPGASFLADSAPSAHLDALSINLHCSFSEIHPDSSLGAVGEAARAEAVGQARFAHIGVADHDYLEDAGACWRQKH